MDKNIINSTAKAKTNLEDLNRSSEKVNHFRSFTMSAII